MEKGLHQKYTVINNETGEEVDGTFILRPEKDVAAFVALKGYAISTNNKALAKDLYRWLHEIKESSNN